MTGFQRLCLATTALVFVLIVIGGTVRATDSGLGCPDWPRCHGSFIPRWEKHTLIEYSHRLTASVVGLMVLAVAVWAWRSYRHNRAVFLPAVGMFLLLLIQGGLGGLTVKRELPPGIVTVHLAMAMLLFALMLLITVAAFRPEEGARRPSVSPNLPGLALAAAALTLAVMLVGAYVSTAHYSLACSGWPLCNGEVVPTLSIESIRLIFFHRVIALVLGLTLVLVAAVSWRSRSSDRLAAQLALAALALYVLQAIIGAANIWTRVADLAQIGHLAAGTLLWGLLAYLTIRLFAVPQLLEAGRPARLRRGGLAGVAR
jgi:heme A synthase